MAAAGALFALEALDALEAPEVFVELGAGVSAAQAVPGPVKRPPIKASDAMKTRHPNSPCRRTFTASTLPAFLQQGIEKSIVVNCLILA